MFVGVPAKIFIRFGEIYSGANDANDPAQGTRTVISWVGAAITEDGVAVYDNYDENDPNARNYTASGTVALGTGSTSTSTRSAATAQAREFYNAPEATVVII